MLGINIPFVYILYTNGLPLTYFMLSLVIIGIYLLLWGMNWIGGADAKFLSTIALITPITPFSYQPFQISFYMWFTIVLGILPLVIYTYNYLKREQKPIIRMFIEVPRGIPYMIPISTAFVIALIYGAVV
jgi:Flp pilus assembly protein protease CpaA